MKVKIVGTGSAVPEKCVTNDDLSQWMDTSDEWIRSRTGIETRHLAVRETTTEMAVEAAKRALASAHMDAEELDLIIAATITPDRLLPNLACEVQSALGARRAVAFDVSAACSGFFIRAGYCTPLSGSRRKPAGAGDWCGDIVADHGLERPEYLCVVWGWRRCGSAGSR